MSPGLISLPIDSYLPKIKKLVEQHPVVLISASPGSGKTTRVPSFLKASTDKKIMVLEPRRIAATMAATRIAQENGWVLGDQVGYQVRFENKSSTKTEVLFVTEALLNRKLLTDPLLADFGLIILDEFHERSIHSDTALALLKELQELERPDLKIVIMSATLDLAKLQSLWPDCGLLDVEVPIYPLTLVQDQKPQSLRFNSETVDKVVEAVKKAWTQSPWSGSEKVKSGGKLKQTLNETLIEILGDVLVFLPGLSEIDRVFEGLSSWASRNKVDLRKLHGSLNLREQKQVLERNPIQRRVILATNVAESSLTLDGVDTVVDCGLEKVSKIHHRTGFQSLELVRASLSSARQRAGRAARQGPGLCIQLWTKQDELSMPQERLPEIFRTDLNELRLLLSALKVSHPHSLPWLDRPPEKKWTEADNLLRLLGAFDSNLLLTEKGQKMISKPLPVRWASLCVESEKLGLGSLGEELSALIQAQVPSKDIHDLLEKWRDRSPGEPKFLMAERIFSQIQTQKVVPFETVDLERLLWTSFPDRLCRLRNKSAGASVGTNGGSGITGGEALMTGEVAVQLPTGVRLHNSEFFLALDLMELSGKETQVSLHFELSQEFVKKSIVPLAKETSDTFIDPKTEKIFRRRVFSFEGCPVSDPQLLPAKPEDLSEALTNFGLRHWEEIIERNESVKNWSLRFRHYLRKAQLSAWPLSEQQIKDICHWASQSERGPGFYWEKDLISFIEPQLDSGMIQEFNRKCPEYLTSPKGRKLKVEYREGIAPLIALRIQDAFGWPESPKIMNEAVVTDLLAPNGRPQQRTQDLATFWKTSYLDVRKDLRARYPKHAWPEDPMKVVQEND